MTIKRVLILGVALVGLVVPLQAGGPSRLLLSDCTGINCNATLVDGHSDRTGHGRLRVSVGRAVLRGARYAASASMSPSRERPTSR